MDFKDYYKILGVEPTADEKAIKAAYRKLARKYHPDVSKERDAEEKFKEAKEAYEMLSDSNKRAAYDQYGHAGVDPNRGMGGGAGAGSYPSTAVPIRSSACVRRPCKASMLLIPPSF